MEKRFNRLTGKGGVGLVCYQLARNGVEFTPTTENSDGGDLWVRTPERIVTLEVKASWNDGWPIRRRQLCTTDFVCFVCMRDARCWVVPSADAAALVAGQRGEVLSITRRMLPEPNEEAWFLLAGGERKRWPSVKPKMRRGAGGGDRYRYNRVVRRTLADGTIKEYRYGPSAE